MGAFLAGLIISGSEYGHETLARLISLRDAFVALFFVTIGILIDPHVILDNLSLLGTMIGLIMAGKLVIWTTVVGLFGYAFSTAILVGIGLTQIGEFSFVLVQVAKTAGHVGADVYNATLAASLLTILLNAALVRYVPGWLGKRRLARERRLPEPWSGEQDLPPQHVVLCGFGAVGNALGKALEEFGLPYVVIERDPDIIRRLQIRGTPCLYGDASQHELLTQARAADASLIVVALPEIEPATLAVRRIRSLNPHVRILARAHGETEAEKVGGRGSDRDHPARSRSVGDADPPHLGLVRRAERPDSGVCRTVSQLSRSEASLGWVHATIRRIERRSKGRRWSRHQLKSLVIGMAVKSRRSWRAYRPILAAA